MTDQMTDQEAQYAAFLASQNDGKTAEAQDADKTAEVATEQQEVAQDEGKDSQAVAAGSEEARQAEELFPGYSTLPEDARAAIDKIVAERDAEKTARAQVETKYQSERNMLVPAQRKVRQLEQELHRLRSERSNPQTAQKPPASDAERVKKLQAELPEEFAAIDELVTAKLSPIDQKLQELEQAKRDLDARRAAEEAIAELNDFDPDWRAKTRSEEFATWKQAICNEADDCYDPMLAEAIHRATAAFDSKAMRSILRQFNRDLDEAKAAQSAKDQKPVVRKPEADFNPRRSSVAVSAKPTYASAEEQAYAEWLAGQT